MNDQPVTAWRTDVKRLGIFVFYDREGIADDYVYYLLDSMLNVLDRLIVVVNGVVCEDSLNRFYTYAGDIVVRDNFGYDAGAYKEVILNLAENHELAHWDELVLFNDTFYGPFCGWQTVFDEMGKKGVDFWGLSKWLGGRADWLGGELPEHLQSYFLVIGKRMLASRDFLEFWRGLEDMSTYQDVICRFEIMFTVYHFKQGFQYASWLDDKDSNCVKRGENVYLKYPYDLIQSCRFPILKRRAVAVTNFVQAGTALRYIEKNDTYNTQMIWNHIKRIEKEDASLPFTFCEVERFVASHNKIYIYGYGKWGHAMESLFVYKGWEIAGIIDSNVEKQNQFIKSLQDIQVKKGDGMVVALGKEWVQEVRLQLKEVLEEAQLLLPNII